jgi:hypothetical protein
VLDHRFLRYGHAWRHAPRGTLRQIACGPAGLNKGKIMALGAAGTTLFGRFAAQQSGSIASFEIKRSTDGGMTWQPGWSPGFVTSAFVQFGKGNEGAPDGYVYLISVTDGNAVQLTRFPPAKWNVGRAYEYFSGTPSAPAWSTRLSARKPIFYDPNGVQAPTLHYVPGLKRYLLTGAHTRPGQAGVFDSPNAYGPWTTVSYVENWLGMGMSGEYWSTYFPLKWQSADGTKLWATFTCHNAGDPGHRACKRYHDRLNVIQATLTLAGNGTNGTGGAGKGKKSTPESGSGTEAMTQAQFATRLQSLVSEAETSGLNKLSMTTALQDQAETLR